jgi:hypothetical protein
MISVADAFANSFLRYYETHEKCSIWPFTYEGIHLEKIAWEIVVEKMFAPLLLSVSDRFYELYHVYTPSKRESIIADMMKSKKTDGLTKMFPEYIYRVKSILMEGTSWGTELNTLRERTSPASIGFDFIPVSPKHDDGQHICFGSTDPHGIARFIIHVHEFYHEEVPNYENITVQLSIDYIHSWNASFVGDISCQAYEFSKEDIEVHKKDMNAFRDSIPTVKEIPQSVYNNPVLPQPKIIHGNKHPNNHERLRETVPRKTILTNKLHLSHYLLECKKMDPRLSCVSEVAISEI